jgi:hypothetical protein
MRPIWISLLVVFLVLPLPPLSAMAEPALWSCTQADGTPIFTNHSKGLTDCRQYALQSELGYMKRTVEEKADVPKPTEPKPQAAPPPVTVNIIVNAPPPSPPPVIEMRPDIGEIPFEVVRMLSVGMTEAEILRRAGPPQATLIGGSYAFGAPYPFWPVFGANRFVYSSGDWLVELTFGGGRVLSINQTRVRP